MGVIFLCCSSGGGGSGTDLLPLNNTWTGVNTFQNDVIVQAPQNGNSAVNKDFVTLAIANGNASPAKTISDPNTELIDYSAPTWILEPTANANFTIAAANPATGFRLDIINNSNFIVTLHAIDNSLINGNPTFTIPPKSANLNNPISITLQNYGVDRFAI